MTMSASDRLSPGERKLSEIDDAYFKVESFFNLLAALVILGLMFLGVFQVVGRKVLNFPVPGYVDVVEVSITVFAFLGIAYCQKLGGHVRMEIIIGKLKGRVFWATEIFGTLVIMIVIAVLMYYSFTHFLRAWDIGDSSMDIEIPLWPSKLLVPLAFFMLLLRLSLQLIGFTRLFLNPAAHQIAIPHIETVDEQAQREIDAGLAGEEEKVVITERAGAD